MTTNATQNPQASRIPPLLTAVELSEAMRISPRQIRSLLTRPGALPRHVKIGKRRFWLESVVADWLAAGGEKQGGAV